MHGDLRRPNVLVKGDGTIRVVDFDWAGTNNVDKYPVAVNPDEKWPDDVEVGKLMKKEHDTEMVAMLLK